MSDTQGVLFCYIDGKWRGYVTMMIHIDKGYFLYNKAPFKTVN